MGLPVVPEQVDNEDDEADGTPSEVSRAALQVGSLH